jgi:hypothetical protein
MYIRTVQPELGTDVGTGLTAPIARPRQVDAAWRPMPSVWWPWMCQLLAADATWTSIELDLIALTPLRARGVAVEPGTPFTIRALRQRGEAELVEAWARDRELVTALAGRDRRSAWLYLGVGRQRTLLHRVVTTLGARP